MGDVYDFWAERLPGAELAAIDRFWERFTAIAPAPDGTFSGTAGPAAILFDEAGFEDEALALTPATTAH